MRGEPPSPAPAEGRLAPAREAWLQAGWSAIDDTRLVDLTRALVDIPSPSGEERAVAEFVVAELARLGLDSTYQRIDEHRGNAIGRLAGSGDGPDLLVYGSLDTTFSGDESDVAVTGPTPRRDLLPHAYLEDGCIRGSGARNPKGANACAIVAVDAVRRAGIPLTGSVTLGLVAGGSQRVQVRSLVRDYSGHRYQSLGTGCEYMVTHGVRADLALNTKPSYDVSSVDPGFCWFRVRVKGTISYVGTKHVTPYDNAIASAARVVQRLEAWFPEYTKSNTRDPVAPQGAVGAIEAGWPYKPSFVPAVCDIYVDMRIHPWADPQDVRGQLEEAIGEIARSEGIEVECEMYASFAGAATEPDAPIVRAAIRAWERVEGRPHQSRMGMSGVTDGAVLRRHGIPTARLGPGPAPAPGGAPPGYRDAIAIDNMTRLARCYVHAIVDLCTSTRAELGLAARAAADS